MLKVAYCLLRDPEVPRGRKVAFLAAIGFILSPLDVPEWVPFIGDLDALALMLLAARLFIAACPSYLVKKHELAVDQGNSVFDSDFAAARQVLASGFELFERSLRIMWQRYRNGGF